MPTTINGVGTQYYGRKNARVYEGVCESCQRVVKMTDYETGYYFVVIFIPVIPLGKKQILGECSACRRHRVLPLHQWETLREETIASGLDQLAENMDDPAKAVELLHNMTTFNQLDEARELAAATVKQHAKNFDALIDIGSWYEQQGLAKQSDDCFATAIALEPENPVSRRIQGVDAIQAGNPADAARHLEPLREPGENYDPSIFYMLATAYQAKELHAEAIEEFTQLIERVPDFANDKTFRKAVKKSEKASGAADSILPKKGLFS